MEEFFWPKKFPHLSLRVFPLENANYLMINCSVYKGDKAFVLKYIWSCYCKGLFSLV